MLFKVDWCVCVGGVYLFLQNWCIIQQWLSGPTVPLLRNSNLSYYITYILIMLTFSQILCHCKIFTSTKYDSLYFSRKLIVIHNSLGTYMTEILHNSVLSSLSIGRNLQQHKQNHALNEIIVMMSDSNSPIFERIWLFLCLTLDVHWQWIILFHIL